MSEKKKITRAGLEMLQAELDNRIAVIRPEIAQEIEFARSYGDLSENAEYTEARKRQAENETKIAELQDTIRLAEVVEEDEISNDFVSVGTTVRVVTMSKTNPDFMATKGEKIRFAMVGDREANPFENRISDECAIGAALIGARVGDTVTIPLDGYDLVYRVEEIEKGDTL